MRYYPTPHTVRLAPGGIIIGSVETALYRQLGKRPDGLTETHFGTASQFHNSALMGDCIEAAARVDSRHIEPREGQEKCFHSS